MAFLYCLTARGHWYTPDLHSSPPPPLQRELTVKLSLELGIHAEIFAVSPRTTSESSYEWRPQVQPTHRQTADSISSLLHRGRRRRIARRQVAWRRRTMWRSLSPSLAQDRHLRAAYGAPRRLTDHIWEHQRRCAHALGRHDALDPWHRQWLVNAPRCVPHARESNDDRSLSSPTPTAACTGHRASDPWRIQLVEMPTRARTPSPRRTITRIARRASSEHIGVLRLSRCTRGRTRRATVSPRQQRRTHDADVDRARAGRAAPAWSITAVSPHWPLTLPASSRPPGASASAVAQSGAVRSPGSALRFHFSAPVWAGDASDA